MAISHQAWHRVADPLCATRVLTVSHCERASGPCSDLARGSVPDFQEDAYPKRCAAENHHDKVNLRPAQSAYCWFWTA